MQNASTNASISKLAKDSSTEKNLNLIRTTLAKAMKQIKEESSSCRALSFIKRISLNLEFQKMEKMLQDLEKGYLVRKHSPNTSQAHNKYIYISEDRRFLCWKSLDKDDQKVMQLRAIENIMNDQLQFKVGSNTIKNFNQALIIKSQLRTLQLQFKNILEKEKFYQQLRMAVKNSRRMHLSYKF